MRGPYPPSSRNRSRQDFIDAASKGNPLVSEADTIREALHSLSHSPPKSGRCPNNCERQQAEDVANEATRALERRAEQAEKKAKVMHDLAEDFQHGRDDVAEYRIEDIQGLKVEVQNLMDENTALRVHHATWCPCADNCDRQPQGAWTGAGQTKPKRRLLAPLGSWKFWNR